LDGQTASSAFGFSHAAAIGNAAVAVQPPLTSLFALASDARRAWAAGRFEPGR